MVRELGPIMTAPIVAGRSGSGFTAELGSMAVDDEVDALATMGFDGRLHEESAGPVWEPAPRWDVKR